MDLVVRERLSQWGISIGFYCRIIFQFICDRKRRNNVAELIVNFTMGKMLLVMTHFTWIWSYPPDQEYICWERKHWIFLFYWPLTGSSMVILLQAFLYSIEASKRMLIYGTVVNVILFLSQSLIMSSSLLPDCFTLYYPPLSLMILSLFPLFLESRQFLLVLRGLLKQSSPL